MLENIFVHYCLQSFSTAQVLERSVNGCFKTNYRQMIKITKKGQAVKFKNYTRKIKSPFIICADFESILVPKNNGKQNSNEPYTHKYHNHVCCYFGYKLVCGDDQFNKSFKSYLGQDAVQKFITSMVKESKY